MASDVRANVRELHTALGDLFRVPLIADPAERRLSGRLGGALWIGGGAVVMLTRLIGATPSLPLGVAVPITVVAFLWGATSLWLIDWVRSPPFLDHLTAGGGVLVLAAAAQVSGQRFAVNWYFPWLALYGCFFFYRRAAIAYMATCFVAQALPPLLHFDAARADGSLWQLMMIAVGYSTVGVALITGKDLLIRLRAQAQREADTDLVTGLGNHRVMDRALAVQAAHAAATGGRFALAVIDVDHLKQLQGLYGHEGADEALRRVARAMSALAAGSDVVSRTGGDEFCWLMPGVDATVAQQRVEASRSLLSTPEQPFPVRFSAGICSSDVEREPAALTRLAEGALYWSKSRGRDQSQIYDPATMDVLSAQERADMLERSQAILGLRALARAIDAKDPATQKHSERVAQIAEQLARLSGWDEASALALHDAAMVHDVGKIGVEDAILRKPGRLTPEERERVNAHAEISKRIVEGVLSPEQVAWIASHHERADGGGYPRGLSAAQIPEGGALLAIADAFDAMTVERPYSGRRTPEEALAICRADAGSHFTHAAVAVLERWLATQPVMPLPPPPPLPVPAVAQPPAPSAAAHVPDLATPGMAARMPV